MTHGLRPRLTIPKLLAVSALGLVAGCPSDDQGDDTGNDSGPSMTTSEGSTSAATVAEGSTSTAAATGETTAADSGSGGTETDTGELPDCQANADQVACEAVMSCQWLPELGGCIIDCTIIGDEATCMEQVGCAWYGDFCDIEPLA